MGKHNFKKLKIWLKAMELCNDIFNITKGFPKTEIYSLTSQINRSVVSVPSNIAEGSSRSSDKDFKRYLEIALGSLYELQTQIVLSSYKEYISKKELETLENKAEELQKMISGFMKSF
ncbi:MAG: four helix bundle protein [Flavobacteriaceae bacterium]